MLLVETPVRLERIGCRCVALRIDERPPISWCLLGWWP